MGGRSISGNLARFTMAEAASRARFYAAFRSGADALGIGWAIWDWNAGFQYWDPGANQPAPGLRAAMFPAPTLRTTGPGKVAFDAAAAKTFRLDRAWSLLSSNSWLPIATNNLTGTNWSFTDPQAGASNAAYYRALWLK